MEIQRMALAELTPADYNPRAMSAAAMRGLRKSIERFGLVQLIVWNKRTNRIVSGHQRFRVLKAKRVKETDIVVVDLPESEEKALNLAMNNQAITGEFTAAVADILTELKTELPEYFEELRLDEIDVVVPTDVEVEYEGMPEFSNEDISAYRQIVVSFRNDQDAEAFGVLIGQPVTAKTRSLWYPAEEREVVNHMRYVDQS